MKIRRLLPAAALALSACTAGPIAERLGLAEAAVPEIETPSAAWDAHPRGEVWTDAALDALDTHASALVETVPEDVETWCPAYPESGEEERKAFWVGLVSALAGHESTWRPAVSGGGGRWHGLLQISPATARGYGCNATSADALKNGPANLSCGLRIMAVTVPRDNVVSAGAGGVAADWGPFHQRTKREAMRAFTRAQPYCAI